MPLRTSYTLSQRNDPGHGWLAVPHELIQALGIQEHITGFSYMTDTLVFLEEDKDLSSFIDAARAAGWGIVGYGMHIPAQQDRPTLRIRSTYCDNESTIRTYASYVPALVGKLCVGGKVRIGGKAYNIQSKRRGRLYFADVTTGRVAFYCPTRRVAASVLPV